MKIQGHEVPDGAFSTLVDGVKSSLVTGLSTIVHGAAEDIEQYAGAIGEIITGAIAEGDDAMVEEQKANLLALAEVNRIRVSASAIGILGSLVSAVHGAAGAGVAALVKTLDPEEKE